MTDAVDPAVSAALDELGAAPLDEFVKTRDRLARALKADGHVDAASAVRSRRRPSVVAWSVNRAARERPELVAALFGAADEVRAAVERGDGDALRTAMRAQRTRLGELTEAAVDRAGSVSPNPGAHAEAIGRTWEAAAGDASLREVVTRGELVTELRPQAALQGTAAAGGTTARATGAGGGPRLRRGTAAPAAAPAKPRPRDELALRRAEDAVEEARAALGDARRSTSEAAKDLARAEKAVRRAREDEARARRRLGRAEATLAERRSR